MSDTSVAQARQGTDAADDVEAGAQVVVRHRIGGTPTEKRMAQKNQEVRARASCAESEVLACKYLPTTLTGGLVCRGRRMWTE